MRWGRKNITQEQRLAACTAVDAATGCHEWTGHKDRKGYGSIYFNGRNMRAHRASYITHVGPIPDGMCVCHRCDNPGCVNPEHLFVGTHGDNALDKSRKGRAAKHWLNKRSPSARLSDEQVAELRLLSAHKSHEELAAMYGVHASAISRIVNLKTYKRTVADMAIAKAERGRSC